MRTRDEVRIALDANFKQFMDCLGQLTEEELTSNIAVGDWSAKDVIGHVWSWSDEAVLTIKAWRRPRPWQEGVAYDDAWNVAQVTAKRGLPLITVVDGVTGAHRRLVHLLDLAEDEMLTQVDRAPWGEDVTLLHLFNEMAGHYVEHAQELALYQKRCLNPDDPDCQP